MSVYKIRKKERRHRNTNPLCLVRWTDSSSSLLLFLEADWVKLQVCLQLREPNCWGLYIYLYIYLLPHFQWVCFGPLLGRDWVVSHSTSGLAIDITTGFLSVSSICVPFSGSWTQMIWLIRVLESISVNKTGFVFWSSAELPSTDLSCFPSFRLSD